MGRLDFRFIYFNFRGLQLQVTNQSIIARFQVTGNLRTENEENKFQGITLRISLVSHIGECCITQMSNKIS